MQNNGDGGIHGSEPSINQIANEKDDNEWARVKGRHSCTERERERERERTEAHDFRHSRYLADFWSLNCQVSSIIVTFQDD